MAITSERLKQTFSEGGALEIYQEVRAAGDFLGFARRYVFDSDYRVARSALWGLTKATDKELSELQMMLNELIEQAMQTENSSVRRLTLNIIERLEMNEDDLRTDFLDFCFEHMVSIEEFPGIQTLCMKLAYRMCTFYPELMDELKRTLEAMEIDYYKPAIKGLRKRILSGRYRLNNQ
jgi:Zn finger protein HypA/HybF involved in hydrogenase expression